MKKLYQINPESFIKPDSKDVLQVFSSEKEIDDYFRRMKKKFGDSRCVRFIQNNGTKRLIFTEMNHTIYCVSQNRLSQSIDGLKYGSVKYYKS